MRPVTLGLCAFLCATPAAHAAEVIDPFFKATGFKENHVYTADAPNERVDPHTGNVSIVHRDIKLPQRENLTLSLVRRYDSKLYENGKLVAAEEHSPMGLGWSLHMGRLHAPTAKVPVYEAPDGTRIYFYDSSKHGARKISREHWMLDINCMPNAACIWDNDGIRYEFSGLDAYYRGGKVGAPAIWPLTAKRHPRGHQIRVFYRKGIFNALGVIDYIVDSYDRKIIFDTDAAKGRYKSVSVYANNNPAVATPPTGYYQTDLFSDNSNSGSSGDLYGSNDGFAAGNTYAPPPGWSDGADEYTVPPPTGEDLYKAPPNDGTDKYQVPSNDPPPSGFPPGFEPPNSGGSSSSGSSNNSTQPASANPPSGPSIKYSFVYIVSAGQNLLTAVIPPVGPRWRYSYTAGAVYSNNGGAIRTMAYPSGATITYSYKSQQFQVNPCNVRTFSVVTQRTIAGRSMKPGTWSYDYRAGNFGDRTVITRPDGKQDIYTFFGMGNIGAGTVWRLGLPVSISRADGAEVVKYKHAKGPVVSHYQPTTPRYGVACAQYKDSYVYSVRRTEVETIRNGRSYRTTYKDFDPYDQAKRIEEVGHLTRIRERTYYYDTNRNMLRNRIKWERVTQNGAYTSTWAYDNFGAMTMKSIAGVVTSYMRDNYGEIEIITDAAQKELRLANYYMGVPRVIGFSNTYSHRRSVDWLGRITAHTNGRGHTTRFAYDKVGRLLKKTPAVGNESTYAYDQTDGGWAKETRGGYWKLHTFDGIGRELSTLESTGKRVARSYTKMGRVGFRSYPYADSYTANGDTFSYDGLGRLTRVLHSDGSFTKHSYTKDYQLDTDERGHQTKTYFSAFGDPDDRLLTRFISVSAHETHYKYGPWGNLLKIDATGTGRDRTYAYNSKGQLVLEKNPENGTVTYGRTPIGLIAWRYDARGKTLYTYDALHRLKKINYPGAESDATFAYDNANNLLSQGNPRGGSVHYEYDKADRRTRITHKGWGHSWVGSYAYNGNDCVTSITYPSGRVVSQTVDGACRVTRIPGYINDVTYAAHGPVKRVTYANGRVTTSTFDERRRTERLTTPGVADVLYGYDPANNVIRADRVAIGINRRMKYDSRNRLVEATGRWGTLIYSSTHHGDRWTKKHNGQVTNHQYDTAGRLVATTGHEVASYTYDAVGNMKSRDGFTHTWDAANRLRSSSGGTAYGYDGNNKRTWKQVGSQHMVYLYGLNGELLSETLSTNVNVRDYVYLNGKAIAVEGRFDL